ncbi:BAHD acyltransferase [Pyrus ussuriensis x Pyrus communis]|uniref:BAHD acyltransferase n=1 Tax=Pyrus ussuriensis x Pyrus communis TaxID=2448454 RepID=A0A5N5GC12_9ROSA|nr:BAHD acyltransferase [Pyrus ussuriensis x Pyrus communis]
MSAEMALVRVGLGTVALAAMDWRAAIFEVSNTILLVTQFSLAVFTMCWDIFRKSSGGKRGCITKLYGKNPIEKK